MGSSSARARREGEGGILRGPRLQIAWPRAPRHPALPVALMHLEGRQAFLMAGVGLVEGGWITHGTHVVITGDGCGCAADERDRRRPCSVYM